MARPLRIEFSGAVYWVITTGNGGNCIYRDDEDRQIFLETLSEVVLRCRWTCHAYCLMSDHYQLCVETPKANLSRGMRHLNGIYTQRFNARHRTFGHLFHGRFRAVVVEPERYLLDVCRSIVTNPVRSGLVTTPEEWPWSSYRGTAGVESPPYYLTTAGIIRRLNGKGDAGECYRTFVAAGEGAEELEPLVTGQVYLGNAEFIRHIQELVRVASSEGSEPHRQQPATRPPLAELISEEGGGAQDRGLFTAHVHHGYTLKEIGAHLGIHSSSVSRRIQKVVQGGDRPLRKRAAIPAPQVLTRPSSSAGAGTTSPPAGEPHPLPDDDRKRYLGEELPKIKASIGERLTSPPVARRMGWSGTVTVSFCICADGRVTELKVVQSSGYQILDTDAIRTIRRSAPFPRPAHAVDLVMPIAYTLE